jgi:Glycosyl transferases group 1
MPTLFEQNVVALATRYPHLARLLQTGGDASACGELGRAVPPLPRSRIDNLQKSLQAIAPENNFTVPTAIVGLEDGRLEAELHSLPCRHPVLPGFKPPIYLLCREVSQLAAVLHHRDWQGLLRDPRFMLFVGENAAQQLAAALLSNSALLHPKFVIEIEKGILPPNTALEQILDPVRIALNNQYASALARLSQIYANRPAQLSSGRLKILGLTSRYTTFLQHSMRDWLSAMRRLGHETRLLIEEADHELLNTLSQAQACADFQPDLILLIDHNRWEFSGMPTQIPSVNWIQDLLPNLFSPEAGRRQSPLDYCLGYGRIRCVAEFGYPESRFMPAVVGVNEQRFIAKTRLSATESSPFDCDVCFVGHTGNSPEKIVREQIVLYPNAAKILWDIYERLANIYAHDGFISDPRHIQQLVRQSLLALNFSMPEQDFQFMTDLFSHQVNHAFFRHQAVQWLLDLDCNIHIYGKGWENHPTLARFAKGVADNQKHLAAIYQSSKINLQIAAHGIVHQRLFEGLCAGGFFLVRHRPGDVVERIHRPLWQFCVDHNIRTDDELKQCATPEVRQLLQKLERCIGLNLFDCGFDLLADLRLSADTNFAQSAGTLWPEQYDQIAFANQTELRDKVHYYLQHPDQRRSISDQMRQIVLERMTYTATSRRLLEFIQKNTKSQMQRIAA